VHALAQLQYTLQWYFLARQMVQAEFRLGDRTGDGPRQMTVLQQKFHHTLALYAAAHMLTVHLVGASDVVRDLLRVA